MQRERRGTAHVMAAFRDAAINQEVLREKAAPLDNVNDLGGRTQPIIESFRSAFEIERLVLIQARRP